MSLWPLHRHFVSHSVSAGKYRQTTEKLQRYTRKYLLSCTYHRPSIYTALRNADKARAQDLMKRCSISRARSLESDREARGGSRSCFSCVAPQSILQIRYFQTAVHCLFGSTLHMLSEPAVRAARHGTLACWCEFPTNTSRSLRRADCTVGVAVLVERLVWGWWCSGRCSDANECNHRDTMLRRMSCGH